MALTLKEQFQIKTVAAFEAADGTKFHMLTEAQSYTRNKMLSAIYKASCKANPEVVKIDEKLFIDLCLVVGRQIGAVMAEPLAADSYDKEIAEKLRNTTSINVTGTMTKEMAEAIAREQRAAETRPFVVAPMPRAVNPDVFSNERRPASSPLFAAPYGEDPEAALDRLIDGQDAPGGLRAAMQRVDDSEDIGDADLDAAIARELATGS